MNDKELDFLLDRFLTEYLFFLVVEDEINYQENTYVTVKKSNVKTFEEAETKASQYSINKSTYNRKVISCDISENKELIESYRIAISLGGITV